MHVDPSLLAKLRIALASGPSLRLAAVFGSRATGKARAGSDVDIGIIPTDIDIPIAAELGLASALSAIVGSEVDLVRLDTAAPLLAREVALHGVCLCEAKPGAFAAWRANAMAQWIEFDEIVAPHRARFLRRLAGRVGASR